MWPDVYIDIHISAMVNRVEDDELIMSGKFADNESYYLKRWR